jgi:hypothetical protein
MEHAGPMMMMGGSDIQDVLTFLLNLIIVSQRRIIGIRLGYECDLQKMDISELFGDCEADRVVLEDQATQSS